jgi:hypothetical protein
MRAEARRDAVLTAVAFITVGASLAMRVVHRGPYYPGWDVVGAANGLFLLSTRTAHELVAIYADHRWQPAFWNTFGFHVALLPGWLASMWPWERWLHVITPCLTALALGLTARALNLPLRALWMVLVPLGASPALLSYAVAGLPYVSNTVPYALALWIVFRWRESIVGTLLLTLMAIGVSWHSQELGRAAFVVFAAAALTLPAASWRIRVAWLLVGAAWCWLVLTYPTANTTRHGGVSLPPVSTWPQHAGALVWHFGQLKPDHPVLVIAGFLAAALVRRERWFWLLLLTVQAGLLFVLASNPGVTQGLHAVWPRRVLVLSFIAVAACAAALRQRRTPIVALLVAILVVGNVWELWTTVRWARRPLGVRGARDCYTLPFTHTPIFPGDVDRATGLDSLVSRLLVDWHAAMRTELDGGRKILLIYNLLSFDENASNPAGIIDRLYLGLGHERFQESVFVFGDNTRMVRELPIRPLKTFEDLVVSIEEPSVWRAYWVHHPNDDNDWPAAARHRAEVAEMFSALERHFRLEWEPSTGDARGRRLHRFSLHRRDGADMPER